MLTKEQYEIERAICDKAQAYVKANGNHIGRFTSEQAAHPDYAACDNAMRSRVEQYEILTTQPETFVAYIGTNNRDGMGVDREIASTWKVTTWMGDVLCNATRTEGWRVRNSWRGERMYQFYARMRGREYTGRGFGEGMLIVFRETAASKRANPR